MKNRLAAIVIALIVFSTSSTSLLASLVFPYSGSYAWHSGQGNDLYNRLTQAFTLPLASPAQLKFQTWYDMETNWDYGYVTISTDGGSTWTALTGNITTTSNPNGVSRYGVGITGASGNWIQAQFDLSSYVGATVEIGFEYETNSSVVSTGWLIDDIEVTSVGFYDDVEAGEDGWSKNPTNGWRVTDRVQQVPEPSTVAIWSLLSLAGLGYGWRKKRKAA